MSKLISKIGCSFYFINQRILYVLQMFADTYKLITVILVHEAVRTLIDWVFNLFLIRYQTSKRDRTKEDCFKLFLSQFLYAVEWQWLIIVLNCRSFSYYHCLRSATLSASFFIAFKLLDAVNDSKLSKAGGKLQFACNYLL